ncbi:DUF433 domain-containing protein [Lysobacter sp. A289]
MQAQTTFGVGVYSYADAARFIGARSSQLRRWTLGYIHKSPSGERKLSPPLWPTQLSETGIEGLGFKDLIELRFVRAFRNEGVPLQVIRRTLEEARDEFASPYPFTCKKFKTDGRRIFMEVIEETGDESLVDIVKRQNVIQKVIGPSLREGVELDMQGEAMRWFPLRGSKSVVFDPARKFGQPILAEYDIPTIAIVDAVSAEGGNEKRVAKLYEIPLSAVRRALEFEAKVVAA